MKNLALRLSSQIIIDWVKLAIKTSHHSSLHVYFTSRNTMINESVSKVCMSKTILSIFSL